MILPSPWLLIGAGLAVVGAYGYGHHAGYAARNTEMQLEIASKNEEARQKEQQFQAQLTENATKLKEANDAITEKQSALDRAINARRVRVSAPGCVQANASTPATGGNWDEAASESERQTLRAIAEIIAQGDRNTAQLNACIDAYNQLREQANGQR